MRRQSTGAACRIHVGKADACAVLPEGSRDGHTEMRGLSSGRGHSANSSPLAFSNSRTQQSSPHVTTAADTSYSPSIQWHRSNGTLVMQ
jgi:hypothetical protein